MKILTLCLLLMSMCACAEAALTPDQLDQAISQLQQIVDNANTMRDRLKDAELNQQGTLVLTAGQRQQLRDEYAEAKTRLQAAFQQVP